MTVVRIYVIEISCVLVYVIVYSCLMSEFTILEIVVISPTCLLLPR